MLILNQRQKDLLAWVNREGYVAVEKMAAHFAVTHQTIRRDITLLAEHKLLQRYHGGASVLSSVENVAYDARQVLMIDEKRRIRASSKITCFRQPSGINSSQSISL